MVLCILIGYVCAKQWHR